MNPEPSATQLLVRDGIRRFLEAEVPIVGRKSSEILSGARLQSYWSDAAGVGVTSLLIPEQFGGAEVEAPVSCLAVVAEEVGRLVAPGPLTDCNVVADTLARRGTREQQDAWLAGIASGEHIAAWAYGEPGDAWLPDALRLRATPTTTGWVLDGVKSPVEAAEESAVMLVTAAGEVGLVQFLVPSGTPGVRIEPLVSLDVAHSFSEVTFEHVHVPADAAVGNGEPSIFDVERQLDLALCVQAAETAAMMQAIFELTVEYLQDRWAFGRVIASYQAIKHRLAEHKVWLEASLALATAAAEAMDRGDASASKLASAAKVHIGEQSMTTLSDCSQLLGGISMTWEHDHHVHFRRATVNRAMYGSPVHHRERLCQLAML